MTNIEAQKVLVTMLMRYVMTDPEMEALVMAGEALDEKITEERHKGEEALYKGFEAGLNRTFPEAEWIPVEMGLPKFGLWVLTYRPEVTEGQTINAEHYMGGDWWGGDALQRGPVTHWRYLPKGPEVEV